MEFRRLNNAGMRRFESFIRAYLAGGDSPSREEILTSEAFGGRVGDGEFDLEADIDLTSRMTLARSLNDAFKQCNLTRDRSITGAPEFWAWLTILLFNKLKEEKGKKRGAFAIWYPERKWTRFYRHVLYGPWRVYQLHVRNVKVVEPLLYGKVTTHGDYFEQLVAYQDIVQSAGVLGAASALYWDEEAKSLKRGHATQTPGSIRRFSAVVQQFALTWDIMAISSDELLDLLPEEFDKWRK